MTQKNQELDSDRLNLAMPKNVQNLQVFPTIERVSQDTQDMQADAIAHAYYQKILDALLDDNDKIKELLIPIGPDHFQLIYINKEEFLKDKSTLKIIIYDSLQEQISENHPASYVSRTAQTLKTQLLPLLRTRMNNNVQLTYTVQHPIEKHQQNDAHSCGHYVVQKAHEIAQDTPRNCENNSVNNLGKNLPKNNANGKLVTAVEDMVTRLQQEANIKLNKAINEAKQVIRHNSTNLQSVDKFEELLLQSGNNNSYKLFLSELITHVLDPNTVVEPSDARARELQLKEIQDALEINITKDSENPEDPENSVPLHKLS